MKGRRGLTAPASLLSMVDFIHDLAVCLSSPPLDRVRRKVELVRRLDARQSPHVALDEGCFLLRAQLERLDMIHRPPGRHGGQQGADSAVLGVQSSSPLSRAARLLWGAGFFGLSGPGLNALVLFCQN